MRSTLFLDVVHLGGTKLAMSLSCINLTGGEIVFLPSLSDVENTTWNTLSAFLLSARGIPQVATSAQSLNDSANLKGGADLAKSKSAISTTGLDDDIVVKAREVFVQGKTIWIGNFYKETAGVRTSPACCICFQEIFRILRANAHAPRDLADMFKTYQVLVNTDIKKHVEEFVATMPNLEQFAEEIRKNLEHAQSIRSLCTDSVQAGIPLEINPQQCFPF